MAEWRQVFLAVISRRNGWSSRKDAILVFVTKHKFSRLEGGLIGWRWFRAALNFRLRDAIAKAKMLFVFRKRGSLFLRQQFADARKPADLFGAMGGEFVSALCLDHQKNVYRFRLLGFWLAQVPLTRSTCSGITEALGAFPG